MSSVCFCLHALVFIFKNCLHFEIKVVRLSYRMLWNTPHLSLRTLCNLEKKKSIYPFQCFVFSYFMYTWHVAGESIPLF